MIFPNNGDGKRDKDDEKRAIAKKAGEERKEESVTKKKNKKGSDENSAAAVPINYENFEKNKRRNSLTDSPLTELSPSSAASNVESVDDNMGEGSGSYKHGSSEEAISTNSSTSISGTYAVNVSNDEKHPFLNFPQNFRFEEAENIDTMEQEYVHEVLVGIKKLIKKLKYNKWTEAFAQAIITGDFVSFLRRFKMIMICLRKRRTAQYSKLTNQQLAAFVAQSIIDRFHDRNEETTIMMVLLANHEKTQNCELLGHGYCRIAHLLLKLLDGKERASLIEMAAKRSKKTALHLAVATGHSCQLRVLLALADINPNMADMSGRAAFHYAVERNNLDMVKMLMWYGADISMTQSWNSKFNPSYISMHANPGATVDQWLRERVTAISQKMLSFARKFCSGHLYIEKEISTPHFLRLTTVSCFKIECQLNLHTKVNDVVQQSAKQASRAVLFMIPIEFLKSDEYSSASDPKIIIVHFSKDFRVAGYPILDKPSSNCTANKLSPFLAGSTPPLFYAYKLPTSIEGLHRLTCRLGSATRRENVQVAVQAFLCKEINQNKSKTD